MSNFLTMLRFVFGTSVAVYVVLVVVTIHFASIQSDLLSSIASTESRIGALESKYYAKIDQVSAMNPGELGFVTPTQKLYARAEAAPTLTRAGN